jgi:hypothetical protein
VWTRARHPSADADCPVRPLDGHRVANRVRLTPGARSQRNQIRLGKPHRSKVGRHAL